MKEIITEKYFVAKARSLGAICYKGSVTHHPDQLILRPKKAPFWVEFKVPSNGLQDGQIEVFKDMRINGHVIYLCNSVEQADEILNNNFITKDFLRKKFKYQKDGVLLNRKTGKEVGGMLNNYLSTSVNDIPIQVHNIIWTCKTGIYPKGVIDHIDGNPLNNRIENLRDVSIGENSRNKKNNVDIQSKYAGICYDERNKKSWGLLLRTHGKRLYYGSFKTEKQAIKKWKEIQTELLGYPPE